jgi:beta-lactamase class A
VRFSGPPRCSRSPAAAATSGTLGGVAESDADRHDALAAARAPLRRPAGRLRLNTGTGVELAHRADERFAFCSTFKGLAAAAVLDRNPMSDLDTVVRYTEADLMASSSITRHNVDTGLTLRQACDAAVRFSDGTAGNLLLREIGGPAGLTRFVRGLGDKVTRSDRREPDLAAFRPGDARDTTHPRAIATDYRKIVLGDALAPAERAFLRDLLERNTTGGNRIRAGLPRDWVVADKTGTGNYGVVNDIAIAWPPRSDPIVLAVMSRRRTEDAVADETLIAETATFVAAALRG